MIDSNVRKSDTSTFVAYAFNAEGPMYAVYTRNEKLLAAIHDWLLGEGDTLGAKQVKYALEKAKADVETELPF